MRRRRPATAMTMLEFTAAYGLPAMLDLYVGVALPNQPHRHYSARCACKDHPWQSYGHMLEVYSCVREAFWTRHQRRLAASRPLLLRGVVQRSDHQPFAEVLYRASGRSAADIETLGAGLWCKRYGDDATP